MLDYIFDLRVDHVGGFFEFTPKKPVRLMYATVEVSFSFAGTEDAAWVHLWKTLQRGRAATTFVEGDTVRNKKPYLGEPDYLVRYVDVRQQEYGCHWIENGIVDYRAVHVLDFDDCDCYRRVTRYS